MFKGKRISLLVQVISIYALIITLFISLAILSVYNFKFVADEVNGVSAHTVPRMLQTKEAQNLFTNALLNMRGFILYADGAVYETNYRKDISKATKEVQAYRETSKEKDTQEQSAKLLQELQEYQVLGEKVIHAKKINASNLAELTTQGRDLVDRINADFSILSEIQGEYFNTKSNAMDKHIDEAIVTIQIASVIISILCIIIALFYTKRLLKRISILNDVVVQIGELNLTSSHYKRSINDEIGDMLIRLEATKAHVRETVILIQESSSTLAASCEELTATTDAFSRSAESISINVTDIAISASESASSITDISTTIEEVSASAEELSAGTLQIDKNTQDAVVESQKGMKLLEEVVNQNETISSSMESIGSATLALNKSSKQIKTIIDVISNIAGQTNLLALNAAIEAARAGEAGKGFAVVAEEVRKLAEQSENSTREISSIIQNISDEINNMTEISNIASIETEKGKEVAFNTKTGFQKIIEQLERVSSNIKEMSQASEEIAQGTQDTAGSIQTVSETTASTSGRTQTVAAATEEQTASMAKVASNIAELANMAIKMNENVSRFKL
ncbi:methyl-accepting chemotaxis protein [Pelosinus fermentans]|uniref:Methyl-accepting chemotaxis sensory transducer n=1 Tax=Pelosinus fermentans JBW45 TaxID=1192197 RepID=I8TY67_9FIRM|nr:methyl-accepting chemotaxis protein [Pelosinus fermentans]AJQ29987.1 methyl-accepting chemotaxis sensory transducer [Pelosinus fermentans JBW45]